MIIVTGGGRVFSRDRPRVPLSPPFRLQGVYGELSAQILILFIKREVLSVNTIL